MKPALSSSPVKLSGVFIKSRLLANRSVGSASARSSSSVQIWSASHSTPLASHVTTPNIPPARRAPLTPANASEGSGRWKSMKAITIASKAESRKQRLEASNTTRGKEPSARRIIPSARSAPNTVADGALRANSDSSVPTPVPRSRTRVASPIPSRSARRRPEAARTPAQ